MKAHYIGISLVFVFNVLHSYSTPDYSVTIDVKRHVANMSHFWESTGFCPPDPHQKAYKYFLSQSMQHNLAYIGSIPAKGIKQVRVHWLLDMVKISRFKGGVPVYDFSDLDKFIDLLWKNGLKPGFELMGNPSNYFTSFENNTQVYEWRRLVFILASHYIGQYGVGYVSTWNFETWNEPDHKDFDGLNITVQGFLNYYDACSEGLKAASNLLILGGPAGSCRQPSYSKRCWALMEHVVNGRNYFSGEKGVRIDYIAFHKKGGKSSGSSKYLIDTELDTIYKIHQQYPTLVDVPIVNDEADPVVGWSKSEHWRSDATYAAMVAKVIAQHQYVMKSQKINYQLLSNDNGFLSYNPHYFDQRTLLARFQMNNTKPPHVQFIRKPVYSVMGLLSLLGETQIHAKINANIYANFIHGILDDLGVLAAVHIPQEKKTSDSWQVSVLLYNSVDTDSTTGASTLSLILKNIPEGLDLRFVQYAINNKHGNPSAVWEKHGKPVFPSKALLDEMRQNEGPVRLQGPAPFSTQQVNNTSLPLPGITLFHICAKPEEPPDQVTNVVVYNITYDQILIVWSDTCVHSRCLKTYEIEFSNQSEKGPYVRINKNDTIFTSYVFAPNNKFTNPTSSSMVDGFYRIRAIDFWNNTGLYSIPVKYIQSMNLNQMDHLYLNNVTKFCDYILWSTLLLIILTVFSLLLFVFYS